MTTFFFVRHGETDWNLEGRFQGRTDIPLNKAGRSQGLRAAKLLEDINIDRIISSPLCRALDTANIIADLKGLSVKIDVDLIECDFGKLEGQSIAQTMQEFDLHAKDQLPSILPDDGESWEQVRTRALATVNRYIEDAKGQTVLFVSHDAVLQSLCEQFCGSWIDSKHGVPYRFDIDDNGGKVKDLKDE